MHIYIYIHTRIEGPPRRARRLMIIMMIIMIMMMVMMMVMIMIMIYHWRPTGAHQSGPRKLGKGITLS